MKKTSQKSRIIRAKKRQKNVRIKFSPVFICIWGATILVSALFSYKYISHGHKIIINHHGVSFSVSKVRLEDFGNQPFIAPSGWRFIIIDLRVSNQSKNDFNFAPVLQTHIKDSKGNEYPISPATLESPIKAGKILPDGYVAGQLSFLVPNSAKGLEIEFSP